MSGNDFLQLCSRKLVTMIFVWSDHVRLPRVEEQCPKATAAAAATAADGPACCCRPAAQTFSTKQTLATKRSAVNSTLTNIRHPNVCLSLVILSKFCIPSFSSETNGAIIRMYYCNINILTGLWIRCPASNLLNEVHSRAIGRWVYLV